jgi:hypothetical protein
LYPRVYENSDGTFTIELTDEDRNALIGPAVEYALFRAIFNFASIGDIMRWAKAGQELEQKDSQ